MRFRGRYPLFAVAAARKFGASPLSKYPLQIGSEFARRSLGTLSCPSHFLTSPERIIHYEARPKTNVLVSILGTEFSQGRSRKKVWGTQIYSFIYNALVWAWGTLKSDFSPLSAVTGFGEMLICRGEIERTNQLVSIFTCAWKSARLTFGYKKIGDGP